MTLTDTHCHLDFKKFNSDRAEVIARARAAGVTRILIPGLNVTSSRAAVKLAESHPMLYAAIGVHPTEAGTWNRETSNELRGLAFPQPLPLSSRSIPEGGWEKSWGEGKVVAIGEIGLDYYWDSAPHDVQKSVLKEQLELATELGLPVVLHMRERDDAEHGQCAPDLLKILEEWVNRLRASPRGLRCERSGERSARGVEKSPLAERPGVLHSFSGSLEMALAAIRLGFYIGVTGPVTFQNARRRKAITAELPLDRLLIETDAPFLAPHPHRGRRNEPAYVRLIADKIGRLHSRTQEEVAAITTTNAARLFSWGEMA